MISVIVPIYKGKDYIKKIVELVENEQKVLDTEFSNQKMELIFVNDFPEDELEQPTSNYIDIKVISHDKNEGIHQARVTGLMYSRGEYIHFLDQDDKVENKFILEQYKNIIMNDADVTVSNGIRKYELQEKHIYKTRMVLKLVKNRKVYIYGTDMIFSPGQCLIKRSSIPALWKQFIMKENGSDDFYLWLIMLSQGCKFIECYNALYYHTENVGNFSYSGENMNRSFSEMINLLAKEKVLSPKEILVLRKRLLLKYERLNCNKKNQILILIKNPLILINTILYKMLGYY